MAAPAATKEHTKTTKSVFVGCLLLVSGVGAKNMARFRADVCVQCRARAPDPQLTADLTQVQ